MPEPIQITDHIDQALQRLIEQYKDQPVLEALISSYVAEVQTLENTLWELIEGQMIDYAVGVNLDVIGRIVGQPRTSGDDEVYRNLLKVRIAINRSSGQWTDLNSVARLLLGAASIRWVNHGRMSISLRVLDELAERPGDLQTYLEEAAGAGTRVDVIYSVDAVADRFAFGPEGAGFQDGGLSGRVSSV